MKAQRRAFCRCICVFDQHSNFLVSITKKTYVLIRRVSCPCFKMELSIDLQSELNTISSLVIV